MAAADAVERLGLPEGRIPLALATIYTARAPTNNTAIVAIDKALRDITTGGHAYSVPPHLRDAHYSGAAAYGHGKGYIYTHDHPELPQDFLPAELSGRRYVETKPPVYIVPIAASLEPFPESRKPANQEDPP
jgi:putative ATPase